MPHAFIYMNGYLGVGKLTIAKELRREKAPTHSKLIPKFKVVDTRLLIDPVAAVYDRSDPEYQPLRKKIREDILDSIATSVSKNYVTWIFTDQQYAGAEGSSIARSYQRAAAARGSVFISIVLDCELAENMRRAQYTERLSDGKNGKLADPDVLQQIRAEEQIHRFGLKDELVLDVTNLHPSVAAERIFYHYVRVSATMTLEESRKLSNGVNGVVKAA